MAEGRAARAVGESLEVEEITRVGLDILQRLDITAIISPGGGNVGIGFAVPINMAKKVVSQLIATGHVDRGRIGIAFEDIDAPAAGRLEGARIREISPGSPAERAGLRNGDVILKANDLPTRSATQLSDLIGLTPVGQHVQMIIERDHVQEGANVEIAPLADQRSKPRGSG